MQSLVCMRLAVTLRAPPGRAARHRARVQVLLVLAGHLPLQHGQVLAVHGARKHGVCDADDQARPERGRQVHLEKEDADDHGHPGHLQQDSSVRAFSPPLVGLASSKSRTHISSAQSNI